MHIHVEFELCVNCSVVFGAMLKANAFLLASSSFIVANAMR